MQTRCMQALKMITAALLLLAALFVAVLPAGAAERTADEITLTVGVSDMQVDDETVSIADGVPILNNGRVYVPLRAVAEAFGADVAYEAATGDVTITLDDTEVVMNTLASIYSVNGELRWMDMAPYINDYSRTMVPVRFVSDALGYSIDTSADDAGNTVVTITRAAA